MGVDKLKKTQTVFNNGLENSNEYLKTELINIINYYNKSLLIH